LTSDVLDDPNTHTGINNLDHNFFRDTRFTLRDVLKKRLIVNNSLNSEIATAMCGPNNTAGRETFKYAMACGLPAGSSVSCGAYSTPVGHSPIVKNTGPWVNNALGLASSPSVLEEVLACVAAHVNAFDDEVSLVLSGENVNPDFGGFGDNAYPEAMWTATAWTSGAVTINVWPSPELEAFCANGFVLENIITARICGIEPPSCFLSYGEDVGDCVADEDTIGTYTCNNKIAIQTWLTEEDMNDIYAGCIQ
jgi:hypothetical protein